MSAVYDILKAGETCLQKVGWGEEIAYKGKTLPARIPDIRWDEVYEGDSGIAEKVHTIEVVVCRDDLREKGYDPCVFPKENEQIAFKGVRYKIDGAISRPPSEPTITFTATGGRLPSRDTR